MQYEFDVAADSDCPGAATDVDVVGINISSFNRSIPKFTKILPNSFEFPWHFFIEFHNKLNSHRSWRERTLPLTLTFFMFGLVELIVINVFNSSTTIPDRNSTKLNTDEKPTNMTILNLINHDAPWYAEIERKEIFKH